MSVVCRTLLSIIQPDDNGLRDDIALQRKRISVKNKHTSRKENYDTTAQNLLQQMLMSKSHGEMSDIVVLLINALNRGPTCFLKPH